MAIQVYFDESGKLQNRDQYVVFAGVAGHIDEHSAFSRDWAALLGTTVKHIHMRDAMWCRGEFNNWNDRGKDRDELLIECAKLTQRSVAMLIASPMSKADFRSLSTTEQQRLKNPVYGGFEGCVRVLAAEFKNHDLSLWYDESQEYAKTCLDLYHRIKSTSSALRNQLRSITFADDTKFPALQAADMVAYSTFVVRRDGESAPMIIREMYSIFNKKRHGNLEIVYGPGAALGAGALVLNPADPHSATIGPLE